jgi:hypothetical protein
VTLSLLGLDCTAPQDPGQIKHRLCTWTFIDAKRWRMSAAGMFMTEWHTYAA